MKYIFTLFILINTLFIFSQVPTIEDEDMGEFGIEKINDFKSYINNRYSIEPIKKNNFDVDKINLNFWFHELKKKGFLGLVSTFSQHFFFLISF